MTEVESRCLWAVLASPVSEAEAKTEFQAVTGRQPERVRFDHDWWFMGWLTPSEAKDWRRAGISCVREVTQDGRSRHKI